MTTLKVNAWVPQNPEQVSMRCPHCRQVGTFEAGMQDAHALDEEGNNAFTGQRRCPNENCHFHVFVVTRYPSGELMTSYPPETIDFDSTNLPKAVLEAFDEAIRCHAASCFRASALLVRRTLEDLCADRAATGKDLKTRLDSLSATVAVPPALVAGLHDLRLLGNDAAHVDLKDFDEVGKTEAELAIEITKELLKAVYQYEDLVARLAARRKPETTT